MKFRIFSLFILIFLNIFSWSWAYNLSQNRFLEVNFLDIGQGDSIFIETPANHKILIDGGPGSKVLEEISKEIPFWERSIDLVVLTHPDKDHVEGLLYILKRYDVKNILWTGIVRDTLEYKEWRKLLEKEGGTIKIAQYGQKIISSSRNQKYYSYIDVLRPFDKLEGKEVEKSNDTAVVTRLVFRDTSFLFTGDITSNVEDDLINTGTNINSDILKVAHHGSKYSTNEDFIENVSPQVAVIQVGKNSYGHPTDEVLERLNKFGVDILRNDQEGSIKIISNGKNYAISSF